MVMINFLPDLSYTSNTVNVTLLFYQITKIYITETWLKSYTVQRYQNRQP